MEKNRLAINAVAPDFNLPGVDGKNYTLNTFSERSVLVVIFSCNHCPYVKAYEDRMIALQGEFQNKGVSFVAINANETEHHPEDTFEKMVIRAREKKFNFPYLRDEDQKVAEGYGAHYTPEIFLLDSKRRLQYTGKIDDNWQQPNEVRVRYLRDAIVATLAGKPVDSPETHAVGCTIKWAKC
ncbi:MAG: thioredoxin family protein [Nitrospirae bacterium]|nr:thioredoxin family protein [Candidatus Troglogloeales bacterium]